jgi:hypothetical protein
MSQEMVRVMDREMEKRGREVKPNVDFFSASVYRMLGFPIDMYTPIFAVARISGWMAHLFEQYADNRLVRPLLVYKGPAARSSSRSRPDARAPVGARVRRPARRGSTGRCSERAGRPRLPGSAAPAHATPYLVSSRSGLVENITTGTPTTSSISAR